MFSYVFVQCGKTQISALPVEESKPGLGLPKARSPHRLLGVGRHAWAPRVGSSSRLHGGRSFGIRALLVQWLARHGAAFLESRRRARDDVAPAAV